VSEVWVVVGGVAIVCALMRLAVPLALGERTVPRLTRALDLAVPALLAALVVTQTFGDGHRLVIDARLVGVAAGGLMALWRKPILVALVVAASTTALVRLIAG
jgi:branched-subunit amino acid transport protein